MEIANLTRSSSRRRSRDRTAILIVSALAVGAAGCSSSADRVAKSDGTARNTAGSEAEATGAAGLGESDTDQDLVDILRRKALQVDAVARGAIDRQAGSCMADAGFDYAWPFPPRTDPITPPQVWRSQTAESWLHSDAGITESQATTAPPATTPEYSQALYGNYVETWEAETETSNPFAGEVLGGDIYDGCLPTAQADIIGDGDPKKTWRLDEILSLLEDVEWQTFDMILADPEFVEATAAWNSCMEANGYPIDVAEAATFVPAQPLKPAEESDAVRSYNECLTQTKLTDIGDRLYPIAREQAEAQLIGDARELEAELDSIASRANEIQ